jgi:putative transposase
MDKTERLNHTKWECKYHVVYIPKGRRKLLYVELRKHLGEVFRTLALHKESRIEEGHVMVDHVHNVISIPPKFAVSQLWATSRAKVPFIWRVCMERRSATS